MEPAGFPQFSYLPPELQTVIAHQSQTPTLIGRLDKYRKRNIMPSVINTSCIDKPISEGELNRFLDDVWTGEEPYDFYLFLRFLRNL